MSIKIGEVYESTNSVIKIKLDDYKCFEDNKESLKVGQYLTIEEGNVNNILATIINIKTVDTESDDIKYLRDYNKNHKYTDYQGSTAVKNGVTSYYSNIISHFKGTKDFERAEYGVNNSGKGA